MATTDKKIYIRNLYMLQHDLKWVDRPVFPCMLGPEMVQMLENSEFCGSLELSLQTPNTFLLNLSPKWSIFLVVISPAQIMHLVSLLNAISNHIIFHHESYIIIIMNEWYNNKAAYMDIGSNVFNSRMFCIHSYTSIISAELWAFHGLSLVIDCCLYQ